MTNLSTHLTRYLSVIFLSPAVKSDKAEPAYNRVYLSSIHNSVCVFTLCTFFTSYFTVVQHASYIVYIKPA